MAALDPVCISGCLDVGVAMEMGVICWRDSPEIEPLMDRVSEAAGENAELVVLGELECEEGVGRFFGDGADL